MTANVANNDSNVESTAKTENSNIPVYPDGSRIIASGNDASISAELFEYNRWAKRNGKYALLLEHRAAALPNGVIAVESANTVLFMNGDLSDPPSPTSRTPTKHSFDNPCPPTADRFSRANAALATGTQVSSISTVPNSHALTVKVAPHVVANESSKLLSSLVHVFGDTDYAEEIIDDADGDGLKLLNALRERERNATAKDRALITAKHQRLIRDGIKGELHLESFTNYLKAYRRETRCVPPTSRLTNEAEVEMISLIATKDPGVREIYELKSTANDPKDLNAAASLLSGILRGRQRCEEIDEVVNGATNDAYVAPAAPPTPARAAGAPPAAAAATNALAALAAAGISPASLSPEQLAAVIEAVKDPRKTSAGKDKDKDKDKPKIPRGPDGKPTRWVEGMAKCRCGINDGKHLFKDCPAEKKKKKEQAAAAAAALNASNADDANAAALATLRALMANVQHGADGRILVNGVPAADIE